MELDRLRQLGREALRGDGAEGPVGGVAAGAPGDLRELRRVEIAHGVPVELAHAREGHVRHAEVEPHADGVGRDEIIDFARLK